jgi:hypothetical protein
MKPKYVRLTSGELLECFGDDERGVITDAGTINWEWVLGFQLWSEEHRRWFSIPL